AHDVQITGAAAQVSGDGCTDLLFARLLGALEQGAACHQHPRRAVAALQSVLFGEAFLHRVQLAGLFEPFDGSDLAAIGLHCEHGTGLDRLTVQNDGARTAVRGVTADVGSRQPKHLADQMYEQQARLDLGFTRAAVDGYFDLMHRHVYSPPARASALRSARITRTRAISRLYSTEPRRSALGALASAASRPASAITASSGFLPARYAMAAVASTGVRPALVNPIPARSMLPFASSVTCTAAAAAAKSPTLRSSFR